MSLDAPTETDAGPSGTSARRPTSGRTDGESPATEQAVVVTGETRRSFTRRDLDALDHVTRECAVECDSGDVTSGAWRGVPLAALLERADASADTTHVVVTGSDGYRMTVAVRDAMGAVLALERDGTALSERGGATPRFVGPDVPGPRAVSGVAEVAAVSLDPGDDPEDLEVLWPDDDESTGESP